MCHGQPGAAVGKDEVLFRGGGEHGHAVPADEELAQALDDPGVEGAGETGHGDERPVGDDGARVAQDVVAHQPGPGEPVANVADGAAGGGDEQVPGLAPGADRGHVGRVHVPLGHVGPLVVDERAIEV